MNHYEIVKKLIGNIKPIGETNTDNERFNNLLIMCELVDFLLSDIDKVAYFKNSQEYSVKRAGDYANKFLDRIGIES